MYLRTANGLVEHRTTPPGSLWPASPWDISPPTNGQMGGGVSGASNERKARSVGTFYACLGVLYDGVGTLPLRQFTGTGEDKKEVDLAQVVYDPWPEITDLDFRGSATWGLAARGNFIGRVTDRTGKGRWPSQIQPLDNDRVDIQRNNTTGALEYRLQGENKVIQAPDIVHVRNITRPGGILGLSVVEELRLTWTLASNADAYAATFFANGSLPTGFLSVEEDLSEEQALAMLDQWKQMHQGVVNANQPAVLTGGAEWHQISVNLTDAQFIAAREYSATEVASIFRIPPHMIGLVDKTTSWGTGIEQQEMGFVRNTLGGYLRKLEIALSRCLPAGQYVEFDLRKRLRGDSVQRAAIIVSLVNAGVINRNEARVLFEDLPPAPGLDAFLQPMNMGEAGTFMPPSLPKGSTSAPVLTESRRLPELSALVEDFYQHVARQ